jgi:mono/diheme cytochrome c family protein
MRFSLLLLSTLATTSLFAADPDGAALFKTRCATCHEGPPQPRMPTRKELESRTPENVVNSMFRGTMMMQSAGLTEEQGRMIAKYVTGKEFAPVKPVESSASARQHRRRSRSARVIGTAGASIPIIRTIRPSRSFPRPTYPSSN